MKMDDYFEPSKFVRRTWYGAMKSKVCRRCKDGKWICRNCAARCCEHLCILKDKNGTATCGACKAQKGTP